MRLFSVNSSLSVLVVSALVALSLISSGAILIQTQAGADTCSGSFVHGYCIAPYANLSHANLHDANLGGARLSRADLSRADLEHANIGGTLGGVLNLSGAICPNGKKHGVSGANC